MVGELQRSAVLGHGANDVIRRAGRDLGFDLERDCHACADDAGEVRDDLFGNAAGIAAHPGRIERDRAVEPLGGSFHAF